MSAERRWRVRPPGRSDSFRLLVIAACLAALVLTVMPLPGAGA